MTIISDFFYDLYSWYSAIGTKRIDIEDDALIYFFEPDFTMSVNGQCLVNNREAFKSHLQSMVRQPGEIKIILPFTDIVIEAPKVAICYQIEQQYENNFTKMHVAGFYLLSKNLKASAKYEINHLTNNSGDLA